MCAYLGCVQAQISRLCLLSGPRSSDTPEATSTHSAQALVSKDRSLPSYRNQGYGRTAALGLEQGKCKMSSARKGANPQK